MTKKSNNNNKSFYIPVMWEIPRMKYFFVGISLWLTEWLKIEIFIGVASQERCRTKSRFWIGGGHDTVKINLKIYVYKIYWWISCFVLKIKLTSIVSNIIIWIYVTQGERFNHVSVPQRSVFTIHKYIKELPHGNVLECWFSLCVGINSIVKE